MIKEALILAGGLGTRLRSVVEDLPKAMAPVAGKPFLHFVIHHLQLQGIRRFIFSLGYKHEIIEEYLEKELAHLDYSIALESEPLGTGGGILLGCQMASEPNILICNGDTLFRLDVAALASFHLQHQSECTLALKPMNHFDRYGVVETDATGRVTSFQEKKPVASGAINGGVYALQLDAFLRHHFSEKFSFEKDYLEANVSNPDVKIFGMKQNAYFIDIGIPEDFAKANIELV